LPQYHYQRLIAVDESSMLSNRRLHDVLKATQMMQIRLIFVGDKKQYPAIESGKPYALLLQSGLRVVYLTDIERQKDNPELLKAVKEANRGDFAAAFQTLAAHVHEIGREKIKDRFVDNRDKRMEAICEDYLSRTSKERAQTLLITLGNDDREMLNVLIREGLKHKGELYGDTKITSILAPRDLTEVERTRSTNYQAEDFIRFNYTNRAQGIEKNQYFKVIQILSQQNLLVLQNDNGKTLMWQPPTYVDGKSTGIEVYKAKEREIQAGDLIRWTRTDKTLQFINPELAQVVSVDQKSCQIRHVKVTTQGLVAEGESVRLQLSHNRYQHWDHAYAMTGYSAQGKTFRSVILHCESYREYLASQPSLIVMLTRAAQDVQIYTDNKEALLEAVLHNTGEKMSALETVGERIYKDSLPTLSTPLNPIASSNPLKPEKPLLDVSRISQGLHNQAEHILERLLGKPKERSKNQYRYGTHKGSLVVTLQGEKRGLWHDFQTGEGGNMLSLVAKESGLHIKTDFKQVLARAVQLLGESEALVSVKTSNTHDNRHKRNSDTSTPSQPLTDEQKRSLHYARRLARESQPIQSTLAERYLREHRGITLETLPKSFRFHPAIYSKINEAIKPALVVIAKETQGKVQAVQAIFLDEVTANKAAVKVQKQTWGLLSCGATVDLGNTQNNLFPIYIAEGPETGLSILNAMPEAHVKVTLSKSNFKHMDTKTDKPIVLCLDNDGDNPSTDKLVSFAAEKLLREGKHVWIAKPDVIGQDYNDLLKEQGMEAVKRNIEQASCYTDYRDQRHTAATLKSEVLDKTQCLLFFYIFVIADNF
jgi:hypothetical protein